MSSKKIRLFDLLFHVSCDIVDFTFSTMSVLELLIVKMKTNECNIFITHCDTKT